MRKLKKGLKLLGLIITIIVISVGLGFGAAIMPNFQRRDSKIQNIELVETVKDEDENLEQEQVKP